MARTTGIKANTAPMYREIDYKGYKIRKTYKDEMFVITPNGTELEVYNKEDAMMVIDKEIAKSEPPKRSKRTTGKKEVQGETEGPIAAYMKNPPISCKYRVEDKEGIWVEAVTCYFTCKDVLCKTYEKLIEGRKERIKAQDYHIISDTCPHCFSPVIEDENTFREIWEYGCGSTGNRKNGQYEIKCNKTKKQRSKNK